MHGRELSERCVEALASVCTITAYIYVQNCDACQSGSMCGSLKDRRLHRVEREREFTWNCIYNSRQLTIQLLNCQIFHVIRADLSN